MTTNNAKAAEEHAKELRLFIDSLETTSEKLDVIDALTRQLEMWAIDLPEPDPAEAAHKAKIAAADDRHKVIRENP